MKINFNKNIGYARITRVWIHKDIEGDVIRMRKEQIGIVPAVKVHELITRDYGKLMCKFNNLHEELVERDEYIEPCDFNGQYKAPAIYINAWEEMYRGFKHGYSEMYYRVKIIDECPMEGHYDNFQYR